MHLVMFDVDGTLVDSCGFDCELFAQAAKETLGVEIDQTWTSYRHVTDSGVLEEIFEQHEITDAGAADRVKSRFVGLVEEFLGDTQNEVREISGAAELLKRLRTIPDVSLAIATGGWRETAELKLARVGIDTRDIPIATASDAAARIDIMRLAAQRAGADRPFASRTYFGDAVWDQKACAELGYSFIAVGSEVEHPIQFRDLADQAAILATLEP